MSKAFGIRDAAMLCSLETLGDSVTDNETFWLTTGDTLSLRMPEGEISWLMDAMTRRELLVDIETIVTTDGVKLGDPKTNKYQRLKSILFHHIVPACWTLFLFL